MLPDPIVHGNISNSNTYTINVCRISSDSIFNRLANFNIFFSVSHVSNIERKKCIKDDNGGKQKKKMKEKPFTDNYGYI